VLLEQEASESYLKGILGFETRPLVSTDYVNDARSSIVDAACTQVRSPPFCTDSAGAGGRLGHPFGCWPLLISESCTFESRWLYMRQV
jgi:hypothetical protein